MKYLKILVILLCIAFLPQLLSAQEVEKVDDGFQFTEGPVWKDGALLFSDIQGNKIYRWSPDSGTTVYRDPSGRSNGLTLDLQGRVVIAGHSARHIARLENKDSLTILATHYKGSKFNSPNDIVVKSDSSIFFTDPLYGLNDIGGTPELDYCGVFRVSPAGKVYLLDSTLSSPNGLCFSPDESLLYVAESNPMIRKIYVYDVVDDLIIANKRQFAYITQYGYLDGMKVDSDGRLFSSGPLGVVVFEPDGTPIDTIKIPGTSTPSNCNWGDEDGKTLYITAGPAVYKVRKTYSKISAPDKKNQKLKSFRLNKVYPNPFNPATKISYELPKASRVELSIYNLLGQRLDTLVSETQAAGSYEYQWRANDMPSGVYFCRLNADGFSASRKMILIR
ncbi:MAG: SMP-30/gluconolactonase/LRE family protein [Calditrichaceae bacterium]|nr:SMP-30/gluconolactonase/LRE family protein [Calditrichaceae bacterium]MBN2710796.1 SMP-30/gluconolactonase/LRE family protein [Calditrichaceae bacterium]RQV94716.1 MAG: T9SS C-terminal target domain-containing protein [Calditrichota bacterium]